jgi:hypothetical protein
MPMIYQLTANLCLETPAGCCSPAVALGAVRTGAIFACPALTAD